MTLSSGRQEAVRWVAITCMVIGHVGVVLLPDVIFLRVLGRIVWPLFAFLTAYNLEVRGVEPVRYLRPLLLWAPLSMLPHYLAFGWGPLNILFTVGLAVVLIVVWHRGGWWGVLVGPLLAAGFLVEYGPLGVALPLLLMLAIRMGGARGAVLAVVAVGLSNGLSLWGLFALPALGVPWLLGRLGVELPRVRRIGWSFYPVHLVLIVGVAYFLQ